MADEPNGEKTSSKPIDILLVEDSETDAKIALEAFNRAKIKNKIYIVENGKEALDFIYHKGEYEDTKRFPRPDLILLDIRLPKVNGFEVLEKIKDDPQYNFIPVVMLTSSKAEEDIIKSYENGASGFIQKPINYKKFVEMVDGFNFYWHVVNKLPDGKRHF